MAKPWLIPARPVHKAQIDAVTGVEEPYLLPDVDAETLWVVTKRGLVAVDRQPGWTWYRWVMAGSLWSVVRNGGRTKRRATVEAGLLVDASMKRMYRRGGGGR